MPKIPLYNQGQGATTRMATSALSPRANVGAFTAPGQAQARLASQAGRVAFQFGQEQKRVEENRIYSESLKEFDQSQFDFITNNKDTNTTVFDKNYGVFADNFLAKIETRTDINQRQKDRIIQKLMPSVTASKLQGARIVFDRGQQRRTIAANEELESTINKISLVAAGTQERIKLQEDAHKLIDTSIADNLRINYTKESFDRGVIATDYEIRANIANSIAKFDATEQEINKNTSLSFKARESLKQSLNRKKTEYRNELFETGVEFVQSSEYTPLEAQAAQEALDKGDPIVLGGQTFDPSDLKPSQRGQLSAVLAKEAKGLEDVATQNLSNGIAESSDPFQASKNIFKVETPQTDQQKETVVLSVAQDIAQSVDATITSGDMSDVSSILKSIETAEKMINEDYRGIGSLLQRTGPMGNTANTIQQTLAAAKKNLTKAVNTGNKSNFLQLSLGEQNFHKTAMDLSATGPEKKKAINDGMMSLRSDEGELFNQPQLNVASGNAVVWDFWKTNLEASSNIVTDPSFKLDDSALGTQNMQAISNSYELYRAMKVRGNVLNSHITNNNVMATYRAIELLEPYFGLEGAIEQVRGFDKDIDRANVKFKDVEKKVNTISEKTGTYEWYSYIPFFEGVEYMPVNKASMAADVGELTKLMIRKGLEGDQALEEAAKMYAQRHIRVMNVVLPKTETIPTQEQAEVIEGYMTTALQSILGVEQQEPLEFTEALTEIKPEFAEEASLVSQERLKAINAGAISEKIDYVADNYDLDDLMFIPRVPGSYDEWTLVTTTLQPVFMNDQGTPLTLTDDQLMMYGDILGYEKKERERIQRNADVWIENNFKLRTGPFAGLSIQKAQQEKERLEGVPVVSVTSPIEWLFGDKKTRQDKANRAIENWERWVN